MNDPHSRSVSVNSGNSAPDGLLAGFIDLAEKIVFFFGCDHLFFPVSSKVVAENVNWQSVETCLDYLGAWLYLKLLAQTGLPVPGLSS